jgi:hypothetical protein
VLTCLLTLSDSGFVAFLNSSDMKEWTPWPEEAENALGKQSLLSRSLPADSMDTDGRFVSQIVFLLLLVYWTRIKDPQIIPARNVRRKCPQVFMSMTVMFGLANKNRKIHVLCVVGRFVEQFWVPAGMIVCRVLWVQCSMRFKMK